MTYVSDANGYLTYRIERQQQSFKLDRGSKVVVLNLADATNSDYFEMREGLAPVASSPRNRVITGGMIAGGLITALLLFDVIRSGADIVRGAAKIESAKSMEANGGAEQITASRLFAEYQANGLGADAKFKGKKMLITGIIEEIGTTEGGTPYVKLQAVEDWPALCILCIFSAMEDNQYKTANAGLSEAGTVTLSPSGVALDLARFSKGQRISIRGEVAGKTLFNVSVIACELKANKI